MMKILQIIKIMERFLLLSFLVLVLGFNSGCSSDGTGAGGTGGADGTGGAGGGDGAGGTSEPAAPTTVSGQVGDDGFHVWLNAPAGGDGSSWGQAYSDLQPAIDAAEADSTKKKVYVTQGTYKPTSCPDQANGECAAGDDKDRKKHFALKNGVSVYGGYSGQGNTKVDNPSKTFLSGDLGDNDTADETTKTDNVYHVFYHPHTEATALTDKAKLENVTITKGNANGTSPHNSGGGMYNSASSPTLTSVNFINNIATSSFGNQGHVGNGGGMYNNNSSPNLTDVHFNNNNANFGGGMYNKASSSPNLNNSCRFHSNSASYFGGAMYSDANSSPTNYAPLVEKTDNPADTKNNGYYKQ